MADLFGAATIATKPKDAKPLGEYRDRGAYYTPDNLALRICRAVQALGVEPRTILEPGCGGGAFLRGASIVWPAAQLLGVDLDPHCDGPGSVIVADFYGKIDGALFDLVLGNPPFKKAKSFIERALGMVAEGGHVAFLLRAALAAGRRGRLYEHHPLFHIEFVVPRPSFTGGGTDKGQEYALLVWKKGHKGDFTGKRLVWKEGR